MVRCDVMLMTIRQRNVESDFALHDEKNFIALRSGFKQPLASFKGTRLHTSLQIGQRVVLVIFKNVEVAQRIGLFWAGP